MHEIQHEHARECSRIHENPWECKKMTRVRMGMCAATHENAYENARKDMKMQMRMHENDRRLVKETM